jgi:hypothetical protein
MSSPPEFLVDLLELRGSPLEITELVLSPTAGKPGQPVGASALGTQSLPEKINDRLVQRFTPAVLLALESVREAGRKIPNRQGFDDPHLLAFNYSIL